MPIEAGTPAEARVWVRLLRDLLTRVVPGAASAVAFAGPVTVDGTLTATGDLSASDTTVGGDLDVVADATVGGLLTASAGLVVAGAFTPPTSAGAAQANRITMSTGVPTAGEGADGDVHVRAGTAGQGTIYRKEAGAWVSKL